MARKESLTNRCKARACTVIAKGWLVRYSNVWVGQTVRGPQTQVDLSLAVEDATSKSKS